MLAITLFLKKGNKCFKSIFIPGASSPIKWRELMVDALTDKNNIKHFKKADDMKMVMHFGFCFSSVVNQYAINGFMARLISLGLLPHHNQVMQVYFECDNRKAVADKLAIPESRLRYYISQILDKTGEETIDDLVMNLM